MTNFATGRYGVEHSLGLYAASYQILPASSIYDDNQLAPLRQTIDRCHIYIIGWTPRLDFVRMRLEDSILYCDFLVAGKEASVGRPVPSDARLVRVDEYWHIELADGTKRVPNVDAVLEELCDDVGGLEFEVAYVGQSFGKDGDRSALDRLRKHETLQKISLVGQRADRVLQVIMVELDADTQLFTLFRPDAEDDTTADERIRAGFDKLYGTTEAERVSLYEAALIRHFEPEFNVHFKNTFPSTNLKLLQDCYDKDFSGLVAEFIFEKFMFRLGSKKVRFSKEVSARFDLHEEDDRTMFFGLER